MPIAARMGSRPGFDLLRAMAAGELPMPPIMATMGVERFKADEGTVSVWMPVPAAPCSRCCRPASGTPRWTCTRFLRPATLDSGVLRCTGTMVSRTRRSAVAEARLEDASGRLLGHATSSCLIFDLPTDATGSGLVRR